MRCRHSLDCVLENGHSRVCRDYNGGMVPQGHRYGSYQAVSFRANPMREIRGSIETEFEPAHQAELLELVEAAEALEPYLTYYLWNEKRHDLRSSPSPVAFFRVCLANHGLEIQ